MFDHLVVTSPLCTLRLSLVVEAAIGRTHPFTLLSQFHQPYSSILGRLDAYLVKGFLFPQDLQQSAVNSERSGLLWEAQQPN